MNKLILVLGAVLISFSTFAQNIPFKIQKSELFKDEFKNSAIVFTKENKNGGVLIVRSYSSSGFSNNEGFYIENYDSNLIQNKKFEFEMKHPNYQKFNLVVGICSFENEVQIIEMYYDLNQKVYVCQSNCIDEDFKITKKELFRITNEEIKKIGYFTLESTFYNRMHKIWTNDNSGKFDEESENFFTISNKVNLSEKAKSEIVMTVNESNNAFAIAIDYNGRKGEYLKLYLFDYKLNKKIETEFSREIKDIKYAFQNIQVDPNGSYIYLLGKSYNDIQQKKKEGGKYLFEVTKIGPDAQKSQLIDTKENFIGSLKSIFHNNQLICIGFYSEINDYKYKGISYFKLDTNSLEIFGAKYNPFSEQFMIDKYGKEKNKELKYLTYKNYFFTKNNDLIFNAQEEYSTSSNIGAFGMNGVGGGNQAYFYHYDDIVSAKLSNEGDLVWARNINKKEGFQHELDKSYVSYTATIVGNRPYYFTNAGEKVKELKNNRIEFKGSNKSNLNLIRINDDGDFEYEKILGDEENEVPFMVANGISIGNSVFFLGKKGSTKQLLKVTL
ncbi:hypothetical protein C8C85_1643 [Flavobacterium sp. 103]|uniref:hypothetical protein n=1 Tax=Flavobacterium sp. 103 TaxID=2135624 RepID=UPI000D5F726E|nr:hypothetical protein [Flavobacterium sp. 103]PVX45836.1 hypothetical protein C8C85_1643 [Flavobacterium sp. 103]